MTMYKGHIPGGSHGTKRPLIATNGLSSPLSIHAGSHFQSIGYHVTLSLRTVSAQVLATGLLISYFLFPYFLSPLFCHRMAGPFTVYSPGRPGGYLQTAPPERIEEFRFADKPWRGNKVPRGWPAKPTDAKKWILPKSVGDVLHNEHPDDCWQCKSW